MGVRKKLIDRAAIVLMPYRAVSLANFLKVLKVFVGSQRTWQEQPGGQIHMAKILPMSPLPAKRG